MSWIKRNLLFVIGSLVALILMGLAGWFLYTKWGLNNDVLASLNTDYAELKTSTQPIHTLEPAPSIILSWSRNSATNCVIF